MTGFGSFSSFCERAPLPVCNLFPTIQKQCVPKGIGFTGHQVQDLGTVLLDLAAVLLCFVGLLIANRKRAAVSRREMQLLLCTFALLSLCDIFTTGRVFQIRLRAYDAFDTSTQVVLGFTSVQLGLTVAFFWMLMLFGIVGFRFMDDGTPLSIGLILGSATVLFTGTLYISLDTAFDLTDYFQDSRFEEESTALYVLYLGLPLVSCIVFIVSQTILLVKILGEKRPLLFLLAATVFFSGGQLLEFITSPYICEGTSRAIDGAFFQTLMSIIAFIWIFVFWDSITEDDWPSVSDPPWRSSSEVQHITVEAKTGSKWKYNSSSNISMTPKINYKPIVIEKPEGMSVNDGVAELNKYKTQFLDQVESEIWTLIKYSQKRDVTAIVAGGREYRIHTQGFMSKDSGYLHRFAAMMKYKDQSPSTTSGLPTYEGEELDSWLTKRITTKVDELYLKFFGEHADIRGKVMLQRLRDNPIAYKLVGQQFATSVRESGEPLTEEMCKALTHLISEQLSNHTMDQLGQQLGHALLHVGGTSIISTFASTLAHTLTTTVGKLVVKIAAKVSFKTAMKAAGKKIGMVAVTGIVTTCASVGGKAVAAKGFGLIGAVIAHAAIPLIIAAVVAMEAAKFTGKVADKIAPEVRSVLAGDFEAKNRSMLEMIGRDSLEDFALQLGKTLALESSLVEHAKETAKEMVKAKIPALQDWE